MESAVSLLHLLNNPRNNESQLASRIVNPLNTNSNDTVDNLVAQTKLNKESKWLSSLIIHYTHGKRLAT
jgi:hypothetical protein